MCYGFNIKRPSIAQWLSVSIPFSPVLETLILTLQFYFEGLIIKAFVDSMCRVLESSLSLAWSEPQSPTQMCVYPREFMTLRVAQFSLKIAHLSFSMVLRGPRACGLRPRLWLLVLLNIRFRLRNLHSCTYVHMSMKQNPAFISFIALSERDSSLFTYDYNFNNIVIS